ncbi:hypothetical protein GCK72_024103 [Caenorhabditis remanei]|uniref:Uncharacterized protein n=1 Tax=Caenorhabditis remanei TaxID=31234 RepID=A0A6A5FY89_CAERE|nr:hypothetical protein GCK72_024103 [Caenorhabditis remanei]KAF1747638.1 hypothetical protein GCK72_024103 [Caenorhabditis remanei]
MVGCDGIVWLGFKAPISMKNIDPDQICSCVGIPLFREIPIRGTAFRTPPRGTSPSEFSPSASDDPPSSSIMSDDRWLSSSRLPFNGLPPKFRFRLVGRAFTSTLANAPSLTESSVHSSTVVVTSVEEVLRIWSQRVECLPVSVVHSHSTGSIVHLVLSLSNIPKIVRCHVNTSVVDFDETSIFAISIPTIPPVTVCKYNNHRDYQQSNYYYNGNVGFID